MALNEKQGRFVLEYIVDFNATKAAIRAGYSENGAGQSAHKLLKNAEIQSGIQEAVAAQAQRTEVDADRVVNELANVAFARFTDVASVDEGGVHFRDSQDWTDETKASVRNAKSARTITKDQDGGETTKITREVAQHDKLKALELLGRRFGIFTDNLNVGGGDNPVVIEWGT